MQVPPKPFDQLLLLQAIYIEAGLLPLFYIDLLGAIQKDLEFVGLEDGDQCNGQNSVNSISKAINVLLAASLT